jgi:predicted AAA+ superfamily ATPase
MQRNIKVLNLLEKSSHFLFGARGIGKSYLIREELTNKADVIDLLHSETYLRISENPSLIENMISQEWVVIGEIQRLPELLNEVHRLIESKQNRFLLTGSSARQLKRKGVNLLAGRALVAHLYPLTWQELENEAIFDLDKYLLLGSLPRAYLEDIGQDYLFAYVDTYLKEEIQAEALVRNLANYHRFLKSAAMTNTEVLNFTKIAQDARLSPNTVRDYYQILEDTHLGYMLPPWQSSKRKAISSAKFYFFDTGVCNALLGVSQLEPLGSLYSKNFEQFIVNEVRAYLANHNIRAELAFWRSRSQQEVDLIINEEIAIEIKASAKVTERDHKGLRAIADEKPWRHLLVVSNDQQELHYKNGIRHLHWRSFLTDLWQGEFI